MSMCRPKLIHPKRASLKDNILLNYFLIIRSNRLKSVGHRSVSQERMMSSSWSAGAGPAGDQRQRLGASLVMPPPSQTNTLRKQVPNVDVSNVTIAGEEILKYFLVKHFLTFPF